MPPTIQRSSSAIVRRRREVRAARDKLSEQLEQLRRVLPEPPSGIELTVKAHVLEHTVRVIEQLMQRATFLAVELAVASPEATRQWVRTCAQNGRKPLVHTVASVMKLFAVRKNWRYAEWWTLDEREVATGASRGTANATEDHLGDLNNDERDAVGHNINSIKNEDIETLHGDGRIANKSGRVCATTGEQAGMGRSIGWRASSGSIGDSETNAKNDDAGVTVDGKPVGAMDDPGNVHGCVVRDSASVMRLAWTLVQRQARRDKAGCGQEGQGGHSGSGDSGGRVTDVVSGDGGTMSASGYASSLGAMSGTGISGISASGVGTSNGAPLSGGGGTTGAPSAPSDEEAEEDIRIAQFARESQRFKFGPRIGMPGRVWTSRRAEWLVDLRDRDVFVRSPLAEEFGMGTCLAVPVQFGGQVHSVMAFYSKETRAYDPDSYDLACVLSRSLEEVYSPARNGPWITCSDNLFPTRGGRGYG